MVQLQLQRVLEDMNYLEPWPSGFRPGYETETTFLFLLSYTRAKKSNLL